ncbi:uncharacterized protein Zasp52 isoform X7 [Plodia interpunctella]|uniref:uncharacterized protein Zasp52 isoform X7 n=1 Tax=Plodia interpunctella TaxID=58824 RepID=UPI0023686747|nr:uncharacterized protein LOC128670700 isoform X7 [Plodia interpunctella]
MAQLITVRLNKSDQQPLGFRLQGGKDFGTPLVVQKVNGGSAAERAGLQAGDALIRVNNTDVYTLRHQDAQDAIRAAGGNLELTVQRGGGTWRPSVTPTGSLPRPGSRPLGASPVPVTSTSLKANPQPSRAFGSGHNNVAKPFGYMNGNDSVKSIVNKQYNTPVNMYSDKTIAETLSAQTEVLAGGVLGVNFKKNEKTYDAEKSAVFKVLQEEQNDPEPEPSHFYSRASVARAGTPCSLHRTHRSRSRTPRVMSTPQPQPPPQPPTPVASAGTQTPAMEQLAPEQTHRPSIPVGCHQVLPDGRIALGAPAVPQPHGSLPVVNDTPYCSDCNRYIVGVFVRIKDKNLHVECFKCSTCGTSLKNQGYYNLNGKLYCDIHAKLVARQNPPAPNLEPVTVPPGGRLPTNSYSTPLPPLATNNNYLNGTQSMFSPSSNLSGPKPFGSSIGSAYSPSLSPRSAPMSPARPLAAPVAPAPAPQPLPTQAAHTPFAPIETQNTTSLQKPEFKSPAEERLIRKMAKMALNGYEIGIQRKIKPAEHIQSMADKIHDTVVAKHPLNADGLSSGESSREGTLRRPLHKNFDMGYKTQENIQSIGDKIKETIFNNHPANQANGNNYSNGNIPAPPPIPKSPIPTYNTKTVFANLPESHPGTNISNGNVPVPPPIPNTPIPTLNAQVAPTIPAINNGYKKPSNLAVSEANRNMANIVKSSNSSISGSSNEDISEKDKVDSIYLNTLRRKDTEKTSFLNGMNAYNCEKQNCNTDYYSNTLNKRKLFEKLEASNNSKNTSVENSNKVQDKTNINRHDTNSTKLCISDKPIENGNHKVITLRQNEDQKSNSQKQSLPKNLYDNTLYTFKIPDENNKNSINESIKILSNNKTDKDDTDSYKIEEREDDPESEIVVRRRQKKTNYRNDDGRRDSHIIARPLSTMVSTDATEGLYAVCHKCDQTIERGPFITALGRIWCPEHFICVNATCRRPLQDIGFVEENGQLYCEYCFEQYIAPACDKCHAKIKGDCLNAIGKHFHPECFNCVYCGKLFGNNPFFLEDGLPYCEADWNELFTTKCFACGFPVEAGDRCAKRTSKDRVSSPREADLSAKYMLANNPQVIYNSDTVYSTTTFRPVSPSPITPTIPDAPSPQRTRKLETPLHFDGGLFSDIRSTDGKLLSRVTVDRVHSSTRHDVTDSPCVFETIGPHIGNKDYVDDIVKTESITNEDVIKVKFTPVPQDLDPPRLLTPSQFRVNQTRTPIEYLKDNYEDLQSYKIVSSLCKEKNIGHDIASSREKDVEHLIMSEPYVRAHSPLANLLVSEQLTKIDHYLQDRLDACSINDKVHGTSDVLQKMRETVSESNEKEINKTYEDKTYYFESSTSNNFGSYQETQKNADGKKEPTPQRHSMNENQDEIKKKFEVKNYEFENNVTSKTKPIEKRGGILNVIYKMPIHYHAAILCFILIVYNLIYQYIKQNCLGNKK